MRADVVQCSGEERHGIKALAESGHHQRREQWPRVGVGPTGAIHHRRSHGVDEPGQQVDHHDADPISRDEPGAGGPGGELWEGALDAQFGDLDGRRPALLAVHDGVDDGTVLRAELSVRVDQPVLSDEPVLQLPDTWWEERFVHLTSMDDVAHQFTEPTTTDGALALSVLESVTVLEAVVRAFHETLAKRRAADLHAVHG
ncbi:hypothetical protein AQJ46_49315 [Streptomyces canus]|uniref:Uncharacterized protein n=1 Tax=Streptomyces canus TaxID=58343 RepID=A0A101RKA2_9ACTN|nr:MULTISPECIES: hypothetical protein [Streptomyces]KUN55605.1 hypothetical protein AQJ46_49315 [Streptomyces canus]MDI5905023.1 hypothetical protein [Streptomyces sp. 12257]